MTKQKYAAERGVLNCGVEFDFVCSKAWLDMEPDEDSRKRFCTSCGRDVFWCHNIDEAALRIEQGECIAVPSAITANWQHDRRIVIAGQASSIRIQLEETYEDLVKLLSEEE